ncbi:hypothetical protein Tco_0955340 [Tanacetum coccineum]|uniref:Integrase, catalytic region, zinc finger, CCHC-type, peptidase aspartic, catalytic n=1 Tax=Tanacetum coccineum TaxID=301880 RepID=A0ABQ5E6Y8_9ASTR
MCRLDTTPMLDRTDFCILVTTNLTVLSVVRNGTLLTFGNKIYFKGIAKDIYSLINHCTDAKDIWDNVNILLEGSELTKENLESQLYDDFEHFRQNKRVNYSIDYLCRGLPNSSMECEHQVDHVQMQLNSKVDRIEVRGTMHGVEVQLVMGEHRTELGMLIQMETVYDLALNVDNVFQADDCDAFDSDVDEAPTAQTMFMANLFIRRIVMMTSVMYMIRTFYLMDTTMITFQYVKDNASVQSNVSSVPNDAYMMIFNDMHEPHAQPVMFELTEREQKIDEQLRIVIIGRNIKEETLKKELHSVKMQLASTINHNKSMVEEVTSLKKDFKQKENKYLKEFLDMKALKEKVEDKLYKQDQSLQTVQMLCKPKPYYDKQNKVAIGYKNPLCLTRAKQVQPALYNGYEIIKNNHVSAIVHNTEDTLEIDEITTRKMNYKMKDPECVTHKVKIVPPDYSKENYLATFTPQKQLTPSKYFGLKISSR